MMRRQLRCTLAAVITFVVTILMLVHSNSAQVQDGSGKNKQRTLVLTLNLPPD